MECVRAVWTLRFCDQLSRAVLVRGGVSPEKMVGAILGAALHLGVRARRSVGGHVGGIYLVCGEKEEREGECVL